MFEKQKNGPNNLDNNAEINEELSREFLEQNKDKKAEDVRIKALLSFANTQIKKQALEIKQLKEAAAQPLVEE
jgi:hypothetical protein